MLMGEEANPHSIKIDISSENDLFFYYIHVVDEAAFKEIQAKQKLMIDFNIYHTVLIKMLNNCIKEPHSFLAVYAMQKSGEAKLEFIQNMEYKFMELMECNFQLCSEEAIRQMISFRYNSMKSKVALLQARLQDVSNMVKIKNPSLLMQLQKPTHKDKTTAPGKSMIN